MGLNGKSSFLKCHRFISRHWQYFWINSPKNLQRKVFVKLLKKWNKINKFRKKELRKKLEKFSETYIREPFSEMFESRWLLKETGNFFERIFAKHFKVAYWKINNIHIWASLCSPCKQHLFNTLTISQCISSTPTNKRRIPKNKTYLEV